MTMTVRPIAKTDREDWEDLWQESATEEGGSLGADVIDACWAQLMQHENATKSSLDLGIHGLIASDEDGAVGFLHYVLHPVAGALTPVCYLQDLYVDPTLRRRGIGRTLLSALKDLSETHGWERIYWLVKRDDKDVASFYEGQSIEVDFAVHMHPTRLLMEMNNNSKDDKHRIVNQ